MDIEVCLAGDPRTPSCRYSLPSPLVASAGPLPSSHPGGGLSEYVHIAIGAQVAAQHVAQPLLWMQHGSACFRETRYGRQRRIGTIRYRSLHKDCPEWSPSRNHKRLHVDKRRCPISSSPLSPPASQQIHPHIPAPVIQAKASPATFRQWVTSFGKPQYRLQNAGYGETCSSGTTTEHRL